MSTSLENLREKTREFALNLPEAYEDFPWGESVIKVNKKIFLFLGNVGDGVFYIRVKLPQSASSVLILPFTEPSSYNLGKYNWITARLTDENILPIEMIQEWILESYRAIAPKYLVKQLDERSL